MRWFFIFVCFVLAPFDVCGQAVEMYWTSSRGIEKADVDGSNSQRILESVLTSPEGFTIDPQQGKIYWTDPGNRTIKRSNLDGSEVEVLIDTDLISPRSIAIDPQQGRIYWTDAGNRTIKQSNLDGSQVEILIDSDLSIPEGITIDNEGSKFYWTDSGNDTIKRSNLDGSQVEILIDSDLSLPEGIAIDAQQGKLYWVDRGNDTIKRSNLDGSEVEILIDTNLDNSGNIAIDSEGGKLYWADWGNDTIKRSNLDGSQVEILIDSDLIGPEGIAIDPQQGKLYWTDFGNDTIKRSNLDGSQAEILIDSDLSSPQGITIDSRQGKLYWTESGSDTIKRSNLDGSQVEVLIDIDLSDPQGIAIDSEQGKLYWTESGSDTIKRSNLDGLQVEILIDSDLNSPRGIAIDPQQGKLYWTDSGNDAIKRSNLDGSQVEILIDSDLSLPEGIAIDPQQGKLYWTDWINTIIKRSNLDGSGAEVLIDTDLSFPQGMTIDPLQGKLYWADGGNDTIKRSNLDGSDFETLRIASSPRYIVLSNTTAPSIISTPTATAMVGTPYSYTAAATGIPAPTFALVNAPAGMTIDPSTGTISWTPTTEGTFNVTVEATNSVGTDTQSFTITVSPPIIVPNIVSAPSTTNATVGEPFQYDVDATGDPAPIFSLDTSPLGMSINESSGIISWTPTNPGRFDVTVIASNGDNSQDAQSFTITVIDASFTVSRNENFDDFTLSTSYQLLSLPGDDDRNIAATLTGTPGSDWNAFLDNGAEENYLDFYRSGDSDFRFRPGRGFWILSKTNWTVEAATVEPVPLNENGQYAIETHDGWNIIASPFLDPVSWEVVKQINNIEPTAPLYAYNGRGFQSVTELEAYRAYYFNSDGSTLLIPHPSYQAPGKSENISSLPNLTLKVSDSEGMEGVAQIVIHGDAQPRLDILDQKAPRDDFTPLSLGFVIDSNTKYAIDARPELKDGSDFDLVIGSRANSEVILDLEATELFDGYALALVDEIKGHLIDLEQGSQIVLRPKSTKSQYRLLVGTDAYIQKERTMLIPQEAILSQNYPNPFNGETTITYSLQEAGPIEIKVYDVLGRSVATLVTESQDAGRYQTIWNGYDRQGREVSAGIYFIQLHTESGERRVIKSVKLD